MEKNKKLTKKQALALTRDAANKYGRYLADNGRTPMFGRTLYKEFAVSDAAEDTSAWTANSLKNDVREYLMDIATSCQNGIPELHEIFASFGRVAKELCQEEIKLEPAAKDSINAILSSEGMHLTVAKLDADRLVLTHSDDSIYGYISLGLNHDRTEFVNADEYFCSKYYFFSLPYKCSCAAEFYADVSRLLSDQDLRDRLCTPFVNYTNAMHDITEREITEKAEAEKMISTTIYGKFKAFAKDILDFDIPEYDVLF